MRMIQRISEIQQLPTLPEIVIRIQKLIMSEEGNATLLARIIEQDPALAAKILKVANSSFYCATSGKISSITLAITRIGFNEVGHIALAVNFVRHFSHKSNVLDYKGFWAHALTAAYLCCYIAENNAGGRFSKQDRHILFLAGLLHDVGILLYDQFFHEQFEHIIERAVKNETSFLVAEKQAVPSEMHGVMGGELLGLWKIDLPIVAAVRFHHAPDRAPENYRFICCAAYLAEYYLCNTVLGSFEGSMEAGPIDALAELNITHEMIINMLQRAQLEVEHSDLMFALEKDSTYSRLKTI
ncbi:MAG: HDOD domain-containing protein [Chitinispirillaceae bacterium]|nr:HDOD domain-containing protein [Chitinispirillaceae bacterium]